MNGACRCHGVFLRETARFIIPHRNITQLSLTLTSGKKVHSAAQNHPVRRERNERNMSSRPGGAMNVFDRNMKRKQKKWAATLPDSHKYDYLRDEVSLVYLTYSLIYLIYIFI